jgi:hypothetical protein
MRELEVKGDEELPQYSNISMFHHHSKQKYKKGLILDGSPIIL